MRRPKFELTFLSIFVLLLTACGGTEVPITVLVNAGAEDYIAAAAQEFDRADVRTPNGNRVVVTVETLEAGEAVVSLVNGEISAEMWIPDDEVWSDIAADQGNADYQGDCASIAQSPLVIGMWRDVAELFGWPGRELGWLDVGSIAADQTTWQYYSGGQYGERLRLGHTHPGLSASGASTLLALVQSAENKTAPVTKDDIGQPIVQASVSAFEGGVSWFSQNTETLGAEMAERGAQFLGAGVMYENTALAEGRGNIVPIYPFEGTFVASHPGCINKTLSDAQLDATRTFRDWLTGTDGQNLAVTYGLRPVADGIDTSPLSVFASVDLNQPQTVFTTPSVGAVYAIQELWQSARKPIHLTMLLDTSGSMSGGKMRGMLAAAEQFVNQMGENDRLTLLNFYSRVDVEAEHALIGENRAQLVNIIRSMRSGGDTSLYDAIGVGSELLDKWNSAEAANALVVLTDGQDTASTRYFYGDRLADSASANDTTVFTIAYGRDADDWVLQSIAEDANGQFFQGDEANINEIYDEMSAAFGGSVGIGR